MPNRFIDIRIAKNELQRINRYLKNHALLIGGLAVNHYAPNRQSKDIDLYLSHETTIDLINTLYPVDEWDAEELNHDEERPHWVIKRRGVSVFPTIEIGPKIAERDPYEFIDWNGLTQHGTQPFISPDGFLENIRVPRVEILVYTKIISFIDRPDSNIEKREKDLSDITLLSSKSNFNLPFFLDYIEQNKAFGHIENKFFSKLSKLSAPSAEEFLKRSDFGRLSRLFFGRLPEKD
jgi:hypothetical protein